MEKIMFIQIIYIASLISVAIWSIVLNVKNKFVDKDMIKTNLIGIIAFVISIIAGFFISYTTFVIIGAILCTASVLIAVPGYSKDKDSKISMSEVAMLLSILYITSATVVYMI